MPTDTKPPGPWIESHASLHGHPKLIRAAHVLGIPRVALIGHLHCLWWWTLSYAESGDLTGFADDQIAGGADWEGDPAAFVQALVNCGSKDEPGFLEETADGRLVIHDWWGYAGRYVERRAQNAERMRQTRASNVQRTSTARAYATGPNRTGPDRTGDPTPAQDPPNAESQGAQPGQQAPTPGGAPPAAAPVSPPGETAAPVPRVRNGLARVVWAVLVDAGVPPPATEPERGKWNGAIKPIVTALLESGVTDPARASEETAGRILAYRRVYRRARLTPTALANHWGDLTPADAREAPTSSPTSEAVAVPRDAPSDREREDAERRAYLANLSPPAYQRIRDAERANGPPTLRDAAARSPPARAGPDPADAAYEEMAAQVRAKLAAKPLTE